MKHNKLLLGRIGGGGIIVLLALLLGCPTEGDEDPQQNNVPLSSMENTVWAGTTPRAGDWLTLTFNAESKVSAAFVIDNTNNTWTYTYEASAKTGTMAVAAGWNPAPDGFVLSDNAKILTIKNYGGHGEDKSFKRLRGTDKVLDENPYTVEALPENLLGTVWAGETPRAGDWLTITFKADGVVNTTFSFDYSKNSWTYTYDTAAKTGTIAVASGWNPAPDGFVINGTSLTIANYGSHDSGNSKIFKRFR